jgi:hypothetical protein
VRGSELDGGRIKTTDEALDARWRLLEHNRSHPLDVREGVVELLEEIGAADRRVTQDYEDRFAIELLQNAHDACHDHGGMVGRAWFALSGSALLVGNQGAPFDASRIKALTRLGVTSKGKSATGRRHVIGYKGVGFSSVFSVTDRPQILSTAVNFGFDKKRARDAVEAAMGIRPSALSARSIPFRLTEDDWEGDWDLAQAMMDNGAVTVIRLPWKPRLDVDRVREVVSGSLSPESLLFMPHLDGLSVDLDGTPSEWLRRAGSSIGDARVVHLDSNRGPTESWIVRDDKTEAPPEVASLDDEIWQAVTELNVSVALPWKGKKVDPDRGPQRLHVYFPTDDQTGRSVLIHGDFYVHSSRRSIQDKGIAGAVSRAVAEKAADLVADLAGAVAPRGGELLSALSVADTPASDFSRYLNGLIDERLKSTSFVRAAGGSALHRPGDLHLVDTNLDDEDHDRFVRALRDPKDLVCFEDAVGDRRSLLERLEAPGLGVFEIATRFSPSKAGPYDDGLELLRQWWNRIPRNLEPSAVRGFSQNRLVQDRSGRWRLADDVRWYERGVPLPPPKLRPAPVKAPTSFELTTFVRNTLKVKTLSASTLLEHIVKTVEAGEYAKSAREKRALLRFVFDLWLQHPEAVEGLDPSELDLIEIPATDLRGGQATWRPASETYLPARLSTDDFAEAIYGPLRAPDFAAPELADLDHHAVADFLRALGAHVSPRELEVRFLTSDDAPDGTGSLVQEWIQEDGAGRSHRCWTNHHDPCRIYSLTTYDRLEAIIQSRDHVALGRLAERLGAITSPFGVEDRVSCRTSCQTNPRRVSSYRRWLLTTKAWIPVEEAGRRSLVPPREAWFGVPRRSALVLPATGLEDDVAGRLGCIDFASPGIAPVERQLAKLKRRDPGRSDDGLEATVIQLLELLDQESASKPHADDGGAEAPWFPASRGGVRTWYRSPLVADLPCLERFDVAVLPRGQWNGLRRRYNVSRAQDTLNWTINVVADPDVSSPLTTRWRPELVALLAQGKDMRRFARAIGRLHHEAVAELSVSVAYDGTTETAGPLPYHLGPTSLDVAGDGSAPETLFTSPSAAEDIYGLSEAIARYLEDERLKDPIATYLSMRDQVLDANRITEARITAAEALIEKYAVESTEASQVVRSMDDLSSWRDTDWRDPEHEEPSAEPDLMADRPTAPDGDVGEIDDLDIPWPTESPTPQVTSNDRVTRREAPVAGIGRATGGRPEAGTSDKTEDEAWAIDRDGEFSFRSLPPHPPRWRSRVGPGTGDGSRSAHQRSLSRDEVEGRAMVIGAALGESLGAEVTWVEKENRGWDLEFDFGDSCWPVEVKGMAGEFEGFVLTRNERRAAETEPEFRFLVVTGLRGPRGEVALIRAADNPLEDAELEPLSWVLEGWREMQMTRSSWSGARSETEP